MPRGRSPVIECLYYAYPIALCLTLLLSRCMQHKRLSKTGRLHNQRGFARCIYGCQALLSGVSLFACAFCARLILTARGEVRLLEACLASTIATLLFFAAALLPEPGKTFSPALPECHSWIVAFAFEVAFVGLFAGKDSYGGHAEISTFAVTVSGVKAAILLVTVLVFAISWREVPSDDETERQSLLGNGHAAPVYNGVANGHHGTKTGSASAGKAATPNPGWFDYFYGFRTLLYYVWPHESKTQQVTVSICVLLLIVQRAINILVPYQLGILVEALGAGRVPWKEITLYIVYSSLQGQQGVIASIRALIWIPVSQSVFRNLTCAAFDHLLGLSLDFHLNKRIGEVISALGKGSSLSTFMDAFAFQLFPMVFDIFLAAGFLFIKFDVFYSLVVAVVLWSYVSSTLYIAKYRGRIKRRMADRNRDMDAVRTDALMSYETVHYNDALGKESDRFRSAVQYYQKAETPVLMSLSALNVIQSLVFTVGILLIVLLSAYQIAQGTQTVGMFVSLLAYMTQLQAPLGFFGSFFNHIQNNLVDAERMLELFKHQPQVFDAADAISLPDVKGNIEFQNVTFSYNDQRPALGGMSFVVAPNTHTALVGDSGGGKSTCLKLLFRFYDVSSGSVKVDGYDVRRVTQRSLRQQIGVVPQDTILFNETIVYNLRYAKPEATVDEIEDACKAANIHDRILGFPNGYLTMVGERGLRLSGGEKQRIAIARVLLRNPRIMLLDEATASLDSRTERDIQKSLISAAKGRTTITIAHRLSTITSADQILVLREGSIIERGTHEGLLAQRGHYFQMWQKQITAKDDEDGASDISSAASSGR